MQLYQPTITGSLSISGSIVLEGPITVISGSVSGTASLAVTSSYSQNSDLLDNLDSTSFVFTSSYNVDSSSFSGRVTNNESTSSVLTTASASFAVVSQSYSSASGSFSGRITTIESKYATTGSNIFTSNQTICGNLTTTGTITAQTINVQQVTSSVVYSCGSNIFGCAITDTQQMTGSVTITGSLVVTTTAPELTVGATGVTLGNVIGDVHQVTGSMFITGSNFRVTATNTCFSGQVCSNTLSTTGNAVIGGTITGTTIYGSTAICGAVICGGATTLTGALSGTSATFSGNVNIQKNQPQIQLYQTGADHNYSILGNTSTALEFWHGTFGANTTKMLSLAAATGAATFSSNVTALSLTVNTADQYLQMNGYNGATTQFISNAGYSSAYNGLQITSNSNNANSLSAWSIDLGGYNSNFSNNDQFNLGRKASGGSWIKFLTITNTGAVTFCSSVSLTSGALSVDGFSTPSNNYITLRSGFSPSASGGIGFMAIDHSGTSADGLALYGHDGMSFYTAQTERMRITAAGIACFSNTVCVGGNTVSAGYYDAMANSGFRIRNSTNTANTGALTRRGLWEGNANYDPGLWAETGYGLYFYTNGDATIKLVMDTAGIACFRCQVCARNFIAVNGVYACSFQGAGFSSLSGGSGTGTASFDTITRSGVGLYEVAITANPNAGGSDYVDYWYGHVLIGRGYSGAAVTDYLVWCQESTQPRTLYPSGGGNLTVTVCMFQNGVESTCIGRDGQYTIRFKISGYNSSYTGAGTTIYLKSII